jgi:hypothetical protein
MLLAVVGAGASYDSVPGAGDDDMYRPPLARDLFAERPDYIALLNDFPHAAPVVSRVRIAVAAGASLESVLEELRSQTSTSPARRQQLLGVQFYLRALLSQCSEKWDRLHGGVTNYVGLADVIDSCRAAKDDPVTYVTFNYDTLLESGLRSTGTRFPDMGSYMSGKVRVLKAHGSVDWGQVVKPSRTVLPLARFARARAYLSPRELCEAIDDLVITDEYVVDDGDLFRPPDPQLDSGPRLKAIPAIAIPTQTKDNFACPTKHIDALKRSLPQVRGVITIGWRGAEEHFLKLLAGGIPKGTPALVVTDTADACRATGEQLERAGITLRWAFYEGGFSGLIRDDVAGARKLRRFVEQVFSEPGRVPG